MHTFTGRQEPATVANECKGCKVCCVCRCGVDRCLILPFSRCSSFWFSRYLCCLSRTFLCPSPLLHARTHRFRLGMLCSKTIPTFARFAVCCSVLLQFCNYVQHTATHCNTLQRTATQQRSGTHCNTLHHTATHCNTLQLIAVCCSVFQSVVLCCSALQCVAVCCSLLHVIAELKDWVFSCLVLLLTCNRSEERYF